MGIREISKEDLEKLCIKLGGALQENKEGDLVCIVKKNGKPYAVFALFKDPVSLK